MNVSLTPKLEDFIRDKVASGLYNNASEVVRNALRLMVEREAVFPTEPLTTVPSKEEVMVKLVALEIPLRELGLKSLALFGSVLHGNAGPGSDIDILVDLDPEQHLSLVDLVNIKNLLEEHLAHEVDVVTRQGIDPTIRDSVFSEAETVF